MKLCSLMPNFMVQKFLNTPAYRPYKMLVQRGSPQKCRPMLLSSKCRVTEIYMIRFGFLGFNASATARVISRRGNDDDEISFLVEETGVPGGYMKIYMSSPVILDANGRSRPF